MTNIKLKPTDTTERISRQQLTDNFDEILEKVHKENIGYVILDSEGKDGQVLCPAQWFEVSSDITDNDIYSIMNNLKNIKEEAYNIVELTINKIKNGEIVDIEGIEDFKYLLMDYGDDYRFFELYKSLREVLKEKYPQLVNDKWFDKLLKNN